MSITALPLPLKKTMRGRFTLPIHTVNGIRVHAPQQPEREQDQESHAVAAGGRTWPISGGASHWCDDSEWIECTDGKWRLVKSGLPLLANGVSNRVGKLRGYGNAIVPQVAAQFVAAFMEIA